MKTLQRIEILLLALLSGWSVIAISGEERVYYEVTNRRAVDTVLAGIKNHLDATQGKAKIVVVAYGKGLDFLLNDAKDRAGNPYRSTIQQLSARGVHFKVCGITLKDRDIDPKRVIPESSVVPEGIPEIERLQAEGYVNLN